MLELYLDDNVKAREMRPDGTYQRKKRLEKAFVHETGELLSQAAQDARLRQVHGIDTHAQGPCNFGRALFVHGHAPECLPRSLCELVVDKLNDAPVNNPSVVFVAGTVAFLADDGLHLE